MSGKDLALIGVAALCLIVLGVLTLSYEALGGVLLGAAISAGLSWHFYRQASDDLRNEAERLRRKTEEVAERLARKTEEVKVYADALLTYLQAAGVIHHHVPRDEAGNPILPTIISMSAAEIGASGQAATVKGGQDKPLEGKEQEGD
jgi:hypothetical protein